MMHYVKNPNLPENTKIVLLGEKYAELLEKPLKNLGIEPIFIPDNPKVSDTVSGHADLSVIHLGDKDIVLAEYLKESELAKKLSALGMIVHFIELKQAKKFPNDCGLNLCICGNNLIFSPRVACSNIVEYLTIKRGLNCLAVKQGYSKCSVCVVSANAIITADAGIYKRAVDAGIDCLKICPGYIDLPGYDYGFIGGAAFKLDKNTLAFTGYLDSHPDKELILNFLGLHNISAVYITEKRVFDIGSVIQIVEK